MHVNIKIWDWCTKIGLRAGQSLGQDIECSVMGRFMIMHDMGIIAGLRIGDSM